MLHFTRIAVCITAATCLMLVSGNKASAQYPVYVSPVQPVVPAVVGYSARRAGLFGQRVVVRPVVAPVAAAPVVAARPVVAPAPVVAARPIVAPVAAAYYAPPVVPVTSYRVPVVPYVPVIGF